MILNCMVGSRARIAGGGLKRVDDMDIVERQTTVSVTKWATVIRSRMN